MRDMYRKQYCNSLTSYSRLKTSEVLIGGIPLGSKHPIRIQSMTNTQTGDIKATVEQCIRIAMAGAHFLRIKVPFVKDTEYLKKIKKNIKKRGYRFPLIA